MILSDREARAALIRNAIRITPDPSTNASLWSSTALDLRLGDQLACWNMTVEGAPACFSPADPDFDFVSLVEKFAQTITLSEAGHPIAPGTLYLGWTLEKIQLPYRSRIAARVEGKSSLARLGLGVHVTAPTIHAGFGFKESDPTFLGNPIQLEIFGTPALSLSF